jgi:bacterioferritin (cytochrome b1)
VAVRNVEYDVLTVLQSKLEGVAVYDQYIKDCQQANDPDCRQLFEEIKRADEQYAERLRVQLKRLMGQERQAAARGG